MRAWLLKIQNSFTMKSYHVPLIQYTACKKLSVRTLNFLSCSLIKSSSSSLKMKLCIYSTCICMLKNKLDFLIFLDRIFTATPLYQAQKCTIHVLTLPCTRNWFWTIQVVRIDDTAIEQSTTFILISSIIQHFYLKITYNAYLCEMIKRIIVHTENNLIWRSSLNSTSHDHISSFPKKVIITSTSSC